MGKQAKIPNAADASVAGIQADTELQPYNYLINAASTLGTPITINGQNYDFTGLGQADTAAAVSDQMAQTLLDLQTEKSPAIIQERLNELKAADPEGYAARQTLFDQNMADAQNNPDRPVSTALQKQLQDQLAKGAGFDDDREKQQYQDSIRGAQVMRGIYLGNAAGSDEAKQMLSAGENLRNQREQNSMALLESGASPEDIAYRQMEQSIGNLGAFEAGQSPTAQFRSLTSAGTGPVSVVGGVPSTNTFNTNAAGQGLSTALGEYSGLSNYNMTQANPWLSGLAIGGQTFGTLATVNPSWFGGGGTGSSPNPSAWNMSNYYNPEE